MNILESLSNLNPECFLYENWEPNWWSLLDLEYGDSIDVAILMNTVKQYAIGYCESNKVTVRPKSDSYAVMFEKDGNQFWFHILKWEFDEEEW